MGLGSHHGLLAHRVRAAVGIVEQAQRGLGPQHPAHRLVHPRHRHGAGAHQFRYVLQEQARDHADVHPGHDRQARGVATVLGEAVGHQLLLGGVVRQHEALEVPVVPKDLGQQLVIGRGRHAVDVVEGAHDRQAAGVHRRLERRQEDPAQRLLAHVGGVVFDPADGGRIAGHVLGGGQDGVGMVQPLVPLEAAHARGGQKVVQGHVLAGALDHPAPALVAGDVDHRRIGLVHARRRQLQRGGLGRAPRQFGIEGRRLGQRHGKHRLQPVDHVGGEQQRYAQPALLHRHALDGPAHGRADAVEQRPDLAGPDHRRDPARIALAVQRIDVLRPPAERIGQQVQLAGLLVDRHARDQILDPGGVTLDGRGLGRMRGAGGLGERGHGRASNAHDRHQAEAGQDAASGGRGPEGSGRTHGAPWRSAIFPLALSQGLALAPPPRPAPIASRGDARAAIPGRYPGTSSRPVRSSGRSSSLRPWRARASRE